MQPGRFHGRLQSRGWRLSLLQPCVQMASGGEVLSSPCKKNSARAPAITDCGCFQAKFDRHRFQMQISIFHACSLAVCQNQNPDMFPKARGRFSGCSGAGTYWSAPFTPIEESILNLSKLLRHFSSGAYLRWPHHLIHLLPPCVLENCSTTIIAPYQMCPN